MKIADFSKIHENYIFTNKYFISIYANKIFNNTFFYFFSFFNSKFCK